VHAQRDVADLDEEDRKSFLALPYRLIPERHRLGLVDEPLQQRLLEVRHWVAENIPHELNDAIVKFDPQQYHSALSVFDNVVFGRVAFSHSGAKEKLRRVVDDLLDEFDLHDEIVLLVDDIPAGPGGSLLPIQARERIALARALAKRPDILVCNRTLASLSPSERNDTLCRLRELLPSSTLIWIDRELPVGYRFDRVFEVRAGRVGLAGAIEEPPVTVEHEQPLSDSQQELNALASVPIFEGLAPARLKLLALTAQRRDYATGEVLYLPGDAADGAHIVLSGEIEVQSSGSRILARVEPGDITGDIAVIANVPYTVTARASSPATTLFVEADALREMIDNDAGVSSRMLSNVSARVLRLVESLDAA